MKSNKNGIHIRNKWNGKQVTILFLHGLGSTGDTFVPLMESLSGSVDVVAVDLPGHGQSKPLEVHTIEAWVKWLDGLVANFEWERLHLAGHSIGADLIVQYALHFPEKVDSLLLLDGGYLTGEAFGQSVEEEVRQTEEHCEGFVFSSWKEFLEMPGAESMKAAMHESGGKVRLKVDVETAKGLTRELSNEPSDKTLQKWSVPSLLLRATEPVEIESIRTKQADRLKNGSPVQVCEIEQAAHDVYLDQKDLVAYEILKWITRINEGTA
ncbi:alpha/beta hydrolase [Halobacillus litoralis]|uniref:alpha/beta fold hydrolase n=1 Tax=Halobacillus litoralis TaxID=45668 RepID=UPI001CD3D020|nr:alpha/beta hydrolase [Halobacillus litoralis]MCA0970214.1 alpha/beta hydrolase [Halobacillus litoralis]